MRFRLAALALGPIALSACAARPAATPWDARPSSRDELLFALPAWCGASGSRRPWTEWAAARDHPPSDRGVCGVRGPSDAEDEGLCVEIEDGRIRRASLRRPGPIVPLVGLAGSAPGEWVEADAGGVPLHVRIEGPAMTLATGDGLTRGPCFWR